MKRQIVLMLVLALPLSFPEALGEKYEPVEDCALPAASDYEDYGGTWYIFQADMYDVTLNGADLLNRYAENQEEGFPDEQKAALRAAPTYELKLADRVLKMVSGPGLCLNCSRQEPQRGVLPDVIAADAGTAFDGTWQ